MHAADLFEKDIEEEKKRTFTPYYDSFKTYWQKNHPEFKTKDYLSLAVIVALFLSIPLTVFLIAHSRDYRGKAAGSPSNTPPDKTKSYNMPVLMVAYYPTTDGVNIDSSVTGFTGTIANTRSQVQANENSLVTDKTNGSKFHGYANPSALPSLNYSILGNIEYLTPLPLGGAVNGGWGYTLPPTVTISGGGGTGATATATIGALSPIIEVPVTNGGSGYSSPPTVTISGGGGTGATAIATIAGGQVKYINVINRGTGYSSPPTVTISGGGGTGATAIARNYVGAPVTGVTVTNGGSGYTLPPTVTISPNLGATATAVVSGGAVTSIYVIHYPDYMSILNNLNICNYVDNQGLKEVWLYGYQYGDITPAESNMAGPYGNVSNSYWVYAQMPVCNHTYVLYNYNETRLGPEPAHDFGHQLEWDYLTVDQQTYVNDFEGPWTTYSNNNTATTPYRCGWTHNPPNTANQYEYNSTHSVWSDCEDWTPEGTGNTKNFNCTEWGCNEEGFHVWQWQNMPGMNNPNSELSNWWDFVGDFDTAVGSGEKLVYDHSPPSIPTSLTATATYANRVSLSWSPSTDFFGIAYYTIKRNGVAVGISAGNSFIDYTVSGGANYSYTVSATDTSGNTSAVSSPPLSVTTLSTTSPAPNQPVLDNSSNYSGGSKVAYSWQHNVGNGPNRLLVVGVSIRGNVTVSSVTFGSAPLTRIGSTSGGVETELWYLLSPPAGQNDVKVILNGVPGGTVAGASSWNYVDQNNPLGGYSFKGGSSTNPNVTTNTTATDTVVDVMSIPDLLGDVIPTPASGQTGLWVVYSSGEMRGAASYKAPQATSTTMSWTTKPEVWSVSAVPIHLGDVQPPTVPTSLVANAISGSEIDLTWTASTDNVGVTGYNIYRDGNLAGTNVNASYQDRNLTSGVTYTYTVSALDAANNVSSQSGSATATTPDTQAPTIPANLTAVAASTTEVDLSWTPSTDNVAVTQYRVFRDGRSLGNINANLFQDIGLNPGTTYTYTVTAQDAAGNSSSPSTTASATTKSNPPVINPPASGKTGDLNGDGRVDIYDLSILLSQWGKGGVGDINGDGRIDIYDLSILLSKWGK